MDVLANSASRGSRRKANSVSSRAMKTSAGAMVFLPAFTVFSLALGISVSDVTFTKGGLAGKDILGG